MVPCFCRTVETLLPGSIISRLNSPVAAVAVCGIAPVLTQVTVSPARALRVAGLKPASVTVTVCLPGFPGAAAWFGGTGAGPAPPAPPAAAPVGGGGSAGGGALPSAGWTMIVPLIPLCREQT